MPEHLRALVILLFLAAGYFYAARGALLQLLPEDTFKRWRNLWVLATLALFLSHGIWVFTLMIGAMLLAYRRKEAHVVGLYFVLLFVAPPAPAVIPGLGLVEYIWTLDHYRLLGLVLLLPSALSLLQRSSTPRMGSSPVDWMVLGYTILLSLLAFREGNVTNGLRLVLTYWVDIFLIYYVASRSIRSEEAFRQALTGFLIAAMLMALIGIFEMLRGWKLYPGVVSALGIQQPMFGSYLTRSGFLRPNATVIGSIVLGYVLVVALGFFFYLKEYLTKPFYRWMALGVLCAGIVASLSRGPWVGAAFLALMFSLSGPRPVQRVLLSVMLGVALLLVLSQFSFGQTLISMLPIIGDVEQENIEYRANLLSAAWPVIERNLLFGSHDYLDAPELQVMINGDGIIDVVNSYIGVALHSGLIGLLFFSGAFVLTLAQLRRGLRTARRHDPRATVLGRALLATVLAIMLIIYTVSSIAAVPVVYWAVLGLAVAYAGLMREQGQKLSTAVSP